MKVLVIPSWYPTNEFPLWGSYFQEQARFLKENGDFDIQILFGEKRSTPLILWIWVYLKSLIKSIWPISQKRVLQNPLAFDFEIPINQRIPDYLQIKIEKRLYWRAYLTFSQNGWKPDLIHAQSGMDAGIYANHISDLTKIPFVIIEHQVFVFHYYSKSRGNQIIDSFKFARKTAAVSYDQRRQVLMNQLNCNPKVIWNLVDEDKYSINLSKRRKKFTIISILNSLPIKGALDFLQALSIIINRDQEVNFIMVGKGGDEKSRLNASNLFVKKSKELGIFEKGEFYPTIERDSIPNILNQAHVFVSPSIQEPFGIAAREAMMCGLPVVSTKNGGVEDVVSTFSGILTTVGSPEELANAILDVKMNISKYNPQKIRNHCIQHCGREYFLKSMREFYEI